MIASASTRSAVALRRRATRVLATFVAAIVVTLLAPFVHPVALELVCSAQGAKLIALDDVDHGRDGPGDSVGHSSADGHAAHCPLCVPAGVPPSATVVDFTPPQALAFVQSSIPAARLAGIVGAPLPARGPPVLS